jgi:hypothetical protein
MLAHHAGQLESQQGDPAQLEAYDQDDFASTASAFAGVHQSSRKFPGCAIPIIDQDMAAREAACSLMTAQSA